MSSRVLISDKARGALEREQDRRIKEKWKRGYSLEQIASEAIIFWASHGDNSITKNIKDPEMIRKLLEGF